MLETFARAIQVLAGHSAVRGLDQQNKLGRCPGATGGFRENQRDAGILVEYRTFGHLDGTACKNRQCHHHLLEVLRTGSRVDIGFPELVRPCEQLDPSPRLGMTNRTITNLQVDIIDHSRHRILHGIGELRICRDDLAAYGSGGCFEQFQELMPGDIRPDSDAECELGIGGGSRDKFAKAAV